MQVGFLSSYSSTLGYGIDGLLQITYPIQVVFLFLGISRFLLNPIMLFMIVGLLLKGFSYQMTLGVSLLGL